MMKIALSMLVLMFCSANAEAQSPTQLGNFPQRTLAQIAGVDSSKNVGLTPMVPLPCNNTNNINPALYYADISVAVNCSTQVQITDTVLAVLNGGQISFPDGSRITNQGPVFNGPMVINYANNNNTTSLIANDTTLGVSNGGNPAVFGCPNISPGNNCDVRFGEVANDSGIGFALSFIWSGSEFSSSMCIKMGNNTCQVTFDPNGNITANGYVDITGPLLLVPRTIASLPSGIAGFVEIAAVNNNNVACTAGAAPVAGGSFYCIVAVKNGGAWQILF